MGKEEDTKLGPGLDWDPLEDKTSVSAVASNDGVIKPCPFCGTEPVPCLNGVNEAGKTFMLIHKINCYLREIEWITEKDFLSWEERAL